MKGGIGVSHKFVKIQIWKCIINCKQSLVPGNHIQQAQRYFTKSLSDLYCTIKAAITPYLPWLAIRKLKLTIIKIAFQKTINTFGIVQ